MLTLSTHAGLSVFLRSLHFFRLFLQRYGNGSESTEAQQQGVSKDDCIASLWRSLLWTTYSRRLRLGLAHRRAKIERALVQLQTPLSPLQHVRVPKLTETRTIIISNGHSQPRTNARFEAVVERTLFKHSAACCSVLNVAKP
jgi:hypothetical protein